MSPTDGGLFIAAAGGMAAIGAAIHFVSKLAELPQPPTDTVTRTTEVRDADGNVTRTTTTKTERN